MSPGTELLERYFLIVMAMGSLAILVVSLYGMFGLS
jgi:hypothetical protein